MNRGHTLSQHLRSYRELVRLCTSNKTNPRHENPGIRVCIVRDKGSTAWKKLRILEEILILHLGSASVPL